MKSRNKPNDLGCFKKRERHKKTPRSGRGRYYTLSIYSSKTPKGDSKEAELNIGYEEALSRQRTSYSRKGKKCGVHRPSRQKKTLLFDPIWREKKFSDKSSFILLWSSVAFLYWTLGSIYTCIYNIVHRSVCTVKEHKYKEEESKKKESQSFNSKFLNDVVIGYFQGSYHLRGSLL